MTEKLDYDKEVEIVWNGQPTIIKLRKPTFGERNKAIKQSSSVVMVQGKPTKELDEVEFKERLLTACLLEAPFEKTIEGLRGVPMDVGDLLIAELEKLLAVSEDEKKN